MMLAETTNRCCPLLEATTRHEGIRLVARTTSQWCVRLVIVVVQRVIGAG